MTPAAPWPPRRYGTHPATPLAHNCHSRDHRRQQQGASHAARTSPVTAAASMAGLAVHRRCSWPSLARSPAPSRSRAPSRTPAVRGEQRTAQREDPSTPSGVTVGVFGRLFFGVTDADAAEERRVGAGWSWCRPAGSCCRGTKSVLRPPARVVRGEPSEITRSEAGARGMLSRGRTGQRRSTSPTPPARRCCGTLPAGDAGPSGPPTRGLAGHRSGSPTPVSVCWLAPSPTRSGHRPSCSRGTPRVTPAGYCRPCWSPAARE